MKYKDNSDRELWERCRQDDEKAFEELFERYSGGMFRALSYRIADTMVAEELVMDAFVNLWIKRGRIEIEGDFRSYLFKCVFNSMLSHLRREVRVMLDAERVGDKLRGGIGADHDLISDDISKVYLSALRRLTPRRRQAFLLSRDEDLTYAEIAERMNVSTGVVDNYITAALEGLRTDMKGCLTSLALLFLPHLF